MKSKLKIIAPTPNTDVIKEPNGNRRIIAIESKPKADTYRWSTLNQQMKKLVILAYVALLKQDAELLQVCFDTIKPKIIIKVKDDILLSATVHKDDAKKMNAFFKKLTK